jgi:hypothetical protein
LLGNPASFIIDEQWELGSCFSGGGPSPLQLFGSNGHQTDLLPSCCLEHCYIVFVEHTGWAYTEQPASCFHDKSW